MAATLPLGYRFCPTEHELLIYLHAKIAGKPLPLEGIITERDIYDENQLQDVFEDLKSSEKGVIYVFTNLKKKGRQEGLKMIVRTVGKMGTWHGYHNSDVFDERGKEAIGSMKTFVYKGVPGTLRKQRCNMDEFTFNTVPDYAVCRIKLQRKQDKDDGKKRRLCDGEGARREDYKTVLPPPYSASRPLDVCSTTMSNAIYAKFDGVNCTLAAGGNRLSDAASAMMSSGSSCNSIGNAGQQGFLPFGPVPCCSPSSFKDATVNTIATGGACENTPSEDMVKALLEPFDPDEPFDPLLLELNGTELKVAEIICNNN
ncbi:hypothetical protein RJ639_028923 [Escallonia herrerae]|uniref:NAC domain-containing protein n=1 Tax=Escallonia herrerae TaxID=1293975 RepID=A0AA88X613_9ASTE|nr:hypothetical protein RJ639_028923 [Escallonia herrerae]